MWRSLLVLVALGGTAAADEAEDLDAIAKAGTPCLKERAHCFGIQLHVAKNEDGTFVMTPKQVATHLAFTDKHFALIDTSFEIVGAEAIDTKYSHVATIKDRDAIARGRMGGRVIHVFLTGKLDDIDKPGDIIYGVTWRAGTRKFIIVSNAAWERTLAHELGHFFGLPHSSYAISIMNKADRKDPPPEQRTFADEEVKIMKPTLKQLVRDKVIAERPRAGS